MSPFSQKILWRTYNGMIYSSKQSKIQQPALVLELLEGTAAPRELSARFRLISILMVISSRFFASHDTA